MNALEIVEACRQHGVMLAVADGRLVMRASGPPLPPSLRTELRDHKAEVLVALGAPLDQTLSSVLADLRPHLTPALRRPPDDRLLVLVNWHIMVAWRRMLQAEEEKR
jgi:hypothetical protein